MAAMKKHICLALFLFYSISTQAATIDPTKLIKVTSDNNAKCVEYYSRQNELFCSTTALQSQSIDPKLLQHEKLNIMFDDRYWQAAWGKNEPNITTIEYVPNGESINNWNELITSQFFPGLQEKVTPKQFAERILENLKSSGYNPIVTFHEDTSNQVIFEFRIDKPANQIQDELQMVTKDKNGLYVLHYVIKKSDMGKTDREKWVKNLKNSTIKT
jgi:hypothetical protein